MDLKRIVQEKLERDCEINKLYCTDPLAHSVLDAIRCYPNDDAPIVDILLNVLKLRKELEEKYIGRLNMSPLQHIIVVDYELNVNDEVLVRLTPHGQEVLEVSYGYNEKEIEKHKKVNGKSHEFVFKIWELMQIFGGDNQYMGSQECFQNNQIKITKKYV